MVGVSKSNLLECKKLIKAQINLRIINFFSKLK